MPADPPVPIFELTSAEAALWGVTRRDGDLRIHTTGARLTYTIVQLVAAIGFITAALVSDGWSAIALAGAVASAVAIAVTAKLRLGGSVVASPEGISLDWLRRREWSWSEVDHLEVLDENRWWTEFGRWFAVEVVVLVLRDGRRIDLWPTRSSVAGSDGTDGPSAASTKRALLQRYRETFAPPA